MPTGVIRPEDCFIETSEGRVRIDTEMYLMSVLRHEWKISNTDEIAPRISLAEDQKQDNIRDLDTIHIYQTSYVSKPVTINYGFTNDVEIFTLELKSSKSRRHFVKFLEEARRIIMEHRVDTFGDPAEGKLSGRQWLKWGVRMTPFEREHRLAYKVTVDIEVHHVYRLI